MTYQEISDIIASIGIQYAYYQFPEGTEIEPPFICFYYSQRDDFNADDSNYAKIETLNIELYTDNKDFDTEAKVEAALPWSYQKTEAYIDSERLYETLYTMEVLING